MKQPKSHPTRRFSDSARFWRIAAAWLMVVWVVAQPAHLLACCLSNLSHDAPHPGEHSIAPHRNHLETETVPATLYSPQHIVHTDGFIIINGAVEATHHHHISCCENCVFATQTSKSARGDFSLTAQLHARVEPVFVFDSGLFVHRPPRAGPPDACAASIYLSSSLLGRAPPFSV